MFFTLSWVILLSAVVILFSSYWIKFLKPWAESFWIKLFIPLILLSYIVVVKEDWVYWGLKWAHWATLKSLYWLSIHVFIFPGQFLLLKTCIVTLLAMIPILFAKWTAKPFRPFVPPYWSAVVLWLILMLMVILPYE